MAQDTMPTGDADRAHAAPHRRAIALAALAAWPACTLFAGCGMTQPDGNPGEKQQSIEATETRRLLINKNVPNEDKAVIGEDDRVSLDVISGFTSFTTPDGGAPPALYDEFKGMLVGVGKLTGYMDCTAMHLGAGIFISSGHCFNLEQEDMERGGTDNCAAYFVEFIDDQQSAGYRCKSVLAIKNSTRSDYAIFEVFDTDNRPIDSIPVARLPPPEKKMPIKTGKVLMASFYEGKKWLSGYCSNMPSSSKNFVFHNCDSATSASGSLIFDTESPVHDNNSISYTAVALHMGRCIADDSSIGDINCAMVLTEGGHLRGVLSSLW
jgi:hypothetical protein